MPDILRILPKGGDYRTFWFTLASGESKTIGNIYRVNETYGVVLNGSNTASLQDFNSSGSAIGTVLNVAGTTVVFIYHAEKIMLPKFQATGEACNPGDNLYLCLTNWLVSPTYQTGRVKIGICVKAATDQAERVMADLKGERPEPELLT